MTSKQSSPEAILSEWRDMGVTTLEELAARVSATTNEAEAAPRRAPVDLDGMLHETPTEVARTITHRAVARTVYVDGSEVGDLQQYDGQPLHFVMSADTLARGPVIAFSRLSELKDHIRKTLAVPTRLIGSTNPAAFTPNCLFYDDPNEEGNVKSLEPGFWFADLTRVVRNVFWQDWNDVISSIAQSRSLRIAWEHVGGDEPPGVGGSSLTLDPGVGGTLDDIGWTDRISSIWNVG